MSPESVWTDEIYRAASDHFDRDPDLHHETVSARMVSAALEKLAEIIEREKPRDVLAFIRNVTE